MLPHGPQQGGVVLQSGKLADPVKDVAIQKQGGLPFPKNKGSKPASQNYSIPSYQLFLLLLH
jgi:hypothetical protein